MERTFSAEEANNILNTLRLYKGSYEKTARKLCLTERDVQLVEMKQTGSFGYTKEGKGPKRMQRYLIATRDVAAPEGWDNKIPVIAEARDLYDEGKIELVTGRDGFNLLLYAIPRREPEVNRKPYFPLQEEPVTKKKAILEVVA